MKSVFDMTIKELVNEFKNPDRHSDTIEAVDVMCGNCGIYLWNGKFRFSDYPRTDPPAEDFHALMGCLLSIYTDVPEAAQHMGAIRSK